MAKKMVATIYNITKTFPAEEKFGMINQIRRAAISISSNLAEGSGRNTPKDQAYFYGLAYSSLMELVNQLIISKELLWLNEQDFISLRMEIDLISVKINALRKNVLAKTNRVSKD